ncbi:MAG TPA: helix-turn-helix transcriptional regulator [Thermoanaerobaculia bacterium]|jgi:transcriptional regulator with XRE-family HTH domain
MRGEKKEDPDARLAMVLLRYFRGWDQGELARAARIAPSQVSVYDRGERAIPREALERMADAVGFPRHLVDPLLRIIRSFRAAAAGWSRAERALGDVLSAELLALGRSSIDAALPMEDAGLARGDRPPLATDREEAADLWARMARRTAKQRIALVEETEEFRGWVLCERVAAESLAVAPDHPRRALELAELTLRIAELTPGPETWRWRLQGYAWAHVSHARRAGGDLPGAEEAMVRARKLWEAGAPGDPGLLEEAVLEKMTAWRRR